MVLEEGWSWKTARTQTRAHFLTCETPLRFVKFDARSFLLFPSMVKHINWSWRLASDHTHARHRQTQDQGLREAFAAALDPRFEQRFLARLAREVWVPSWALFPRPALRPPFLLLFLSGNDCLALFPRPALRPPFLLLFLSDNDCFHYHSWNNVVLCRMSARCLLSRWMREIEIVIVLWLIDVAFITS